MTNDSGEKLTFFIFTGVKVLVAAFVIKILLYAVGFTGYIPIGDEVFAFIMKAIMILGTGRSVFPTHM